jgi:hypothetical protein
MDDMVHRVLFTSHVPFNANSSGGSSGSLTAFFTEAIFSNPYVSTCGDVCCSMDEQNARLSFLFRGFEELATSFQSTFQDDTVRTLLSFLGIVADLEGTEEQQARGVANLIQLMVRIEENKKQIWFTETSLTHNR